MLGKYPVGFSDILVASFLDHANDLKPPTKFYVSSRLGLGMQ